MRRIHGDAFAQHGRLGHDLHGAGGLLAAHHRGFCAGPAEQKTRRVAATTHAVVAGTKRGAALDGDLRHRGTGHGLDHLGAVFDHAALLAVLAHHVTRGVLQVDDGLAQLAQQLDEMSGLVGTGHINRAVVADDAHRMAANTGLHTNRGSAVQGLEGQEVRAVDQPCNHLLHVHRLAQISGHQTEQIFGWVQGLICY